MIAVVDDVKCCAVQSNFSICNHADGDSMSWEAQSNCLCLSWWMLHSNHCSEYIPVGTQQFLYMRHASVVYLVVVSGASDAFRPLLLHAFAGGFQDFPFVHVVRRSCS